MTNALITFFAILCLVYPTLAIVFLDIINQNKEFEKFEKENKIWTGTTIEPKPLKKENN